MPTPDKTLLCRYHYDPLDRLAACTPSTQARTQRFYLKERLISEVQGSERRSIFQQGDQLLAQQQRQDDAVKTTLLATDLQRSVLHALDAMQPRPLAYTPYGHRPAENGLLSLLGFNGERPDPVTGHYLLGNGYRAFNPVLMRFNSPDNLSPFGEGGLNAYGYCEGDPINKSDSTGRFSFFSKLKLRFWKPLSKHNNRKTPATPYNLVGIYKKKETHQLSTTTKPYRTDRTQPLESALAKPSSNSQPPTPAQRKTSLDLFIETAKKELTKSDQRRIKSLIESLPSENHSQQQITHIMIRAIDKRSITIEQKYNYQGITPSAATKEIRNPQSTKANTSTS
ncbi:MULTISPECIES: RHS repeat-associated core domain-containing protein [Pseudomonas]|uniref:RHS repeat-associated core domain-containing protein n=1 Tax=Pseudomonas kilonensis TaxID=132476 RepID=A0ABY0YSI4_9PSED|nr:MULTISPECIES: RHS repeat-associated core domain-containing protein [Pseudomonas]EPJ83955.1 hypothetical protein CFII68_17995 [Pseudomonas sp. CFII68]SED93494.1 RHS repeat-associated core domain-containing protein [Pseudomonas kilonensis]